MDEGADVNKCGIVSVYSPSFRVLHIHVHVQGCTFFLWGYTHFVIMYIVYTCTCSIQHYVEAFKPLRCDCMHVYIHVDVHCI